MFTRGAKYYQLLNLTQTLLKPMR